MARIFQEAVEHFDKNEEEYVSRSNQSDFEWARQSMVSMRMAEHYYQNILDIKSSKRPLFSGLNGRETAMHQNMMWVLETQRRQLRSNEKLRQAKLYLQSVLAKIDFPNCLAKWVVFSMSL